MDTLIKRVKSTFRNNTREELDFYTIRVKEVLGEDNEYELYAPVLYLYIKNGACIISPFQYDPNSESDE